MINVVVMTSPRDGQTVRAPVVVETIVERRRDHDAADVADLSMLATWGCVLLLGLACLHVISNPLPLAGGRADGIPALCWWVWATTTALCKTYGRLRGSVCWRCRGARSGFLMWVALSIGVYLPGVPVMSWVFMPVLAVVEAVLFLRLCSAAACD